MNDRILYNLRNALEVEKMITSVNISVGQWSDGLLPIKMMDEPTSAAFSHTVAHTHTHTSLFFYTLTQTYRTVGDENKSVMGHSLPGGFNPEKAQPFQMRTPVSPCLFFPLPFLAHSLILFFPWYMPLESLLIRLMRGISLG